MTTIPTFTTLGCGPTILMLHGIGGGHLAFAPQVETYASAGYRAVAWDMPGYGHSAPIEPYTFKGLAEACIRLIEALMAGDLERHRDERGEPDRPPRRAAPSQASPPGGSEVHAVTSVGASSSWATAWAAWWRRRSWRVGPIW